MLLIPSYAHRGLPAAPGATNPYAHYLSLNLNAVPFVAGAGAYWPQRDVPAPDAPNISRQVNVSTWAAFDTESRVAGTRIDITGSFSSAGDNINGSMTDVDVVIPPEYVISGGLTLGNFNAGQTLTRVRFRPPTIGGSGGGQVHNVKLFALANGVRFTGIGMTGGALGEPTNKVVALECATAASGRHQRLCLDRCRGHAGNSFFLGQCDDFVAVGNSIYAGADTGRTPPDDEAWVFRVTDGSLGFICFDNDIRSPRFHKIRLHAPSTAVTQGLSWIHGNTIVDMTEARIFWFVNTGGGSGRNQAAWFDGNTIHAEDNSASFAPDISGNSTDFCRVTNNTFYGDFVDGNITANGTVTDFAKSGNVFNGSVAEPAWTRAGDPTTLDWSP